MPCALTPTSRDLEQAVNLFLRTHVTLNTKLAYGRALSLYTDWLPQRDLNVTLETACDYRDHVLRKFKASTAAQHISAVKAFYKTLKELDVIGINVWALVKAPTQVNTVAATKALTPALLDKVYAQAQKGEPRDLLIVRIMYEAALRRFEVAGLLKNSMEDTPDGPALRLVGKGGKHAYVGISDDLAAAIRKQAEASETGKYLFPGRDGGHISERQINNIVSACGIHPHQLRHTHCTDALGAGHSIQDVSRTLRHSNIATTMRYFSTRQQINSSSARVVVAGKNGNSGFAVGDRGRAPR